MYVWKILCVFILICIVELVMLFYTSSAPPASGTSPTITDLTKYGFGHKKQLLRDTKKTRLKCQIRYMHPWHGIVRTNLCWTGVRRRKKGGG